MQEAPQTAHLSVVDGLSGSTDFLAISKISCEMIGSAIGFFFIIAFTIEQIGCIVGFTLRKLEQLNMNES
ncbi:MAG: hypothetical protein WB992_23610 [Bryobacteraceae bacterium]